MSEQLKDGDIVTLSIPGQPDVTFVARDMNKPEMCECPLCHQNFDGQFDQNFLDRIKNSNA